MNWSCLPIGSRSRSISIWQACSAMVCGTDDVLLIGMQRAQQRRREAAGRAEPGPGRNIGHARDLQPPAGDIKHFQRLANDRMLELVDRGDRFKLRIFDDEIIDECRDAA